MHALRDTGTSSQDHITPHNMLAQRVQDKGSGIHMQSDHGCTHSTGQHCSCLYCSSLVPPFGPLTTMPGCHVMSLSTSTTNSVCTATHRGPRQHGPQQGAVTYICIFSSSDISLLRHTQCQLPDVYHITTLTGGCGQCRCATKPQNTC